MAIYFPVDESYLIAAWLESFFWGAYTIFIGHLLYKIVRKGIFRVRKVSMTAILVLYCLCTAHMAVTLRMLINAFVVYRETIGPVAYYEDRESKLYVSGQELYVSCIVVGDSIVVWRLYVVWGKKLWIAAFPIMMIIGTAISGYGAVSQFLLKHPVYETAVNWATAMYAITLSTNILVTTATAARIWYVNYHRGSRPKEMDSPYFRVALLIVESGLFLGVAKIIEFALYRVSVNVGLSGDHALWIVLEAIPQIMGIMPTLIVLAINSGLTKGDEFYAMDHPSTQAFTREDELPTTMSVDSVDPAKTSGSVPLQVLPSSKVGGDDQSS